MPFVSKKQRAFAHANPDKFGGEEGLAEWDSDTPSDLPTYANGKTTSPDVKKKFQWTPARHRTGYTKDQRAA